MFLGLSLCVFTWGLQYKLSLYNPPQSASRQIPKAKLLSKEEGSDVTQTPLVLRTKTVTTIVYTAPATALLFLLLVLRSLVELTSSGLMLAACRQRRRRSCDYLNILYVRPPPALL